MEPIHCGIFNKQHLSQCCVINDKMERCGISTAKDLVLRSTAGFEQEFLWRCKGFEKRGKSNEKLERYLWGLKFQIPGNVVWSLHCPRYRPELRYDANLGIEDMLAKRYWATVQIAKTRSKDEIHLGTWTKCVEKLDEGRRYDS